MQDGGISKQLTKTGGAYTLDGGTDVDDNAKAQGDVVNGKLGAWHVDASADIQDTAFSAAALLSAYTFYTGWRVGISTVSAQCGVAKTIGATVGVIELGVFAIVTTTITGTLAETLQVDIGVTPVIAATTCTSLAEGEIWHDNAPDALVEDMAQIETYIVQGGQDVIITQSGTDPWDTGSIVVYMRWRPLDGAGSLVAADWVG